MSDEDDIPEGPCESAALTVLFLLGCGWALFLGLAVLLESCGSAA